MNSCSGRRPRIMASSLSLPQNTITDILSRLPVKSLTRFKLVSKNWAHLTSTPAFIAAHLRRSSSDPSLLIRRYRIHNGSEFGFWLITNPTRKFRSQLLDFPSDESLLRLPKIVGSVDGLVCLDVSPCYASDFVLWNPGTKQFKHLPFPLITSSKSNPIWLVFLGFGFDSFNNDYKLVRIVSFKRNDASPFLRVEVYSWREGVWKEIEESFDSTLLCGVPEGVVVDGSLNWLAIGLQDFADRKFVISFDMGREVFKRIALPAVTRFGNVKVMSYMGLLAIAVYPLVFAANGINMNRFEFWVQSDGEDGSKHWTRMVAIENFSKTLVPMGTWRDREVVIKHIGVNDRENYPSLLLYDPVDEGTKRLPVDGVDFCVEGYSYVESLVSVNEEAKMVVEQKHSRN
ncbi:F-box domain - like 10 [Theobroma cacao]|uniref:F-box family protein, putative n=1 Tax=Theobroma cacao TaxID=3641 RepID=A0A061G2V2_THECC|nr:F-box family protein, putative [Theobroma cacao]WRX17756.1 F-box domain - like 10 [Theobroma cacao]